MESFETKSFTSNGGLLLFFKWKIIIFIEVENEIEL